MTAPAVPMTAARTEFDCTTGDGARLSLIYDCDGVELRNKCRGEVVGVHVGHDTMPALIAALSGARHWPQPVSGQLTGQQMYEAFFDDPQHGAWNQVGEFSRNIWNAAAARLAAPQGVGFDARALRIALVAEFPTLAEWGARIEETIRRHTPSVAAGREVVPAFVEVTGEELHAAAYHDTKGSTPWPMLIEQTRGYYKKAAADLNARLRARAGTAGQTTEAVRVKVTAEHVRRVRAMLAALGDDVTNSEATDELIATAYNYMMGDA